MWKSYPFSSVVVACQRQVILILSDLLERSANPALSLWRQFQVLPCLRHYDGMAFADSITTPVNLIELKGTLPKGGRSIPIGNKLV